MTFQKTTTPHWRNFGTRCGPLGTPYNLSTWFNWNKLVQIQCYVINSCIDKDPK